MDNNPYAPPSQQRELPHGQPEVCVDGEYLVVTDKAVLPQRCVVTNEPVALSDIRHRQFEWAQSFQLVLRRQRCRLSYYVNRRHRLSLYRNRAIVSLIALFFGWVIMGVHVVWFVPVAPFAIFGLAIDRLTVKTARDGQFWITGCSEAFLSSCEQELGTY